MSPSECSVLTTITTVSTTTGGMIIVFLSQMPMPGMVLFLRRFYILNDMLLSTQKSRKMKDLGTVNKELPFQERVRVKRWSSLSWLSSHPYILIITERGLEIGHLDHRL